MRQGSCEQCRRRIPRLTNLRTRLLLPFLILPFYSSILYPAFAVHRPAARNRNRKIPALHNACLVIGPMLIATCFMFSATEAAADDSAESISVTELSRMSLEDLSNIEITSVSKKSERMADAPASVFVITNEDIRRSGATSLPEALRLAPNLTVSRVNANEYAISARGFNNGIGNKLLVLIDGRTVYTPLFSGVNWDAQNVMLEDVERIEVISGPGATLWGANAVNGVINVITYSAQDTQGGLVSAGTGNQEANGAMRYGGKIGEDGHYRVYGIGLNRKNTEHADGSPVPDNGERNQTGFRADWGSARHSFTLQGDAYKGGTETGPLGAPTISGATSTAGANLLARWSRQYDNGSEAQLQTYLDHNERDNPSTFRDIIDTIDGEFQHSFTLAAQHKILWGGGYRYAVDNAQTHFLPQLPLSAPIEFIPNRRKLDWANVFAQDEVALSRTINLTLGLKAESNAYTGVEYLPSARLAWKPDANQLLWAAVSRAVRAPARLDRDFNFYLYSGSTKVFTFIQGGPDFQSEVVKVIEIGYRAQPLDVFSYSITAYRSFYDKLRSGQPAPAFIQNMMYGTTSGIEAWGSYQATQIWCLSAGWTALRERFALYPGSLDPDGFTDLGNDPANTWMLRSTLNLTSRHDFDITVRHVSALPNPTVPQYTAVDARLAWRPKSKVELSLVAQNLLVPPHVEFGDPATSSEINHGFYGKVAWEF